MRCRRARTGRAKHADSPKPHQCGVRLLPAGFCFVSPSFQQCGSTLKTTRCSGSSRFPRRPDTGDNLTLARRFPVRKQHESIASQVLSVRPRSKTIRASPSRHHRKNDAVHVICQPATQGTRCTADEIGRAAPIVRGNARKDVARTRGSWRSASVMLFRNSRVAIALTLNRLARPTRSQAQA